MERRRSRPAALHRCRSRGRDSGQSRLAAVRWSVSRRRSVLVGKSRDGAIGPGPSRMMAARQLEEAPDIRHVFTAFRAFPRHAPVQAELTAPTDGTHSPYIGHRYPFPRCCEPLSRVMKVRLIIRSQLVGAREQSRRHGKAKSFHQLKLGHLIDRQSLQHSPRSHDRRLDAKMSFYHPLSKTRRLPRPGLLT
jgi:hypothetical protein